MMPAPDRDDATERRFAELETRLAFQEQSLHELSDALAEARLEGQRNRELLGRVLEDLKQLRRALVADPASEPPPPHY
ncbi:SlyX family protein [Silanimonas sp.]|uniref:SlyX family protein n=1 Tax=Silanimonas sp. TaxID=1929290 RepID=UPI001BBA5AFF|nr:SlyX family protein [Silanimonas sp.]MBS3896633.1 SlyX family protein [Silanimonas sp.]MBS3924242.1 SlyX family protein [Xanthomonadaceae bacterium]